MTQEQRTAVGAIRRILQEHTLYFPTGDVDHSVCDGDGCDWEGSWPDHSGHVALVLVSELGLVLS